MKMKTSLLTLGLALGLGSFALLQANAYMGQRMPACGMPEKPAKSSLPMR